MPQKTELKFKLAVNMCLITFGMTIGWWFAYLILTPMGYNIPPFDAAQSALILTPIFGLLFSQFWIDAKNKEKHSKNDNNDN